MKRARRGQPDPTLLFRAVRWTRLPGHARTIAEGCARFGITVSAYRKARRELGRATDLATDEDIFLGGLAAGPSRVDSLLRYYDWVNHSGMSEEEAVALLERLVERGHVRRVGDLFELTCEWP